MYLLRLYTRANYWGHFVQILSAAADASYLFKQNNSDTKDKTAEEQSEGENNQTKTECLCRRLFK